jgi:hypothetical protein
MHAAGCPDQRKGVYESTALVRARSESVSQIAGLFELLLEHPERMPACSTLRSSRKEASNVGPTVRVAPSYTLYRIGTKHPVRPVPGGRNAA